MLVFQRIPGIAGFYGWIRRSVSRSRMSDDKSPSEHRNKYSKCKGLRSTKFKQSAGLVPKGIRIAEDAWGIAARQVPRAARHERREDVRQLVGGKCAQRQGGNARAFELAEACGESNALARRDARGDEVACLRRRARGPFTFRGVPKDGLRRGRGLLAAGAGRYSRPARRSRVRAGRE